MLLKLGENFSVSYFQFLIFDKLFSTCFQNFLLFQLNVGLNRSSKINLFHFCNFLIKFFKKVNMQILESRFKN